MVKFKIPLPDRTECVYRKFINGNCTGTYYFRPFDFSELVTWLDGEE